MRKTKRVRATIQRVPFHGQPNRYLPGPAREVIKDTGKLEIVGPGPSMPVPWTPYWRQRLADGLIELVEPAATSTAIARQIED